MAYKGVSQILSTNSLTTLYTAPSSTTSIINRILVCNVDSSADTIEIAIYKGGTGSPIYLAKTIPVAANVTFVLDGPIVLETTDLIKFKAATANRLHVNFAVLEGV